jgi:hypothetical protein
MDLHENEYQETWSVISSFVPTSQTQRILEMKTKITARNTRVAEPRPDTKNNMKVGHLDIKNKKIHSILSIEFRI